MATPSDSNYVAPEVEAMIRENMLTGIVNISGSSQPIYTVPQWQMNGGYTGNPATNLTTLQEVQQELHKRQPRQRQVQPETDYFHITDANESRLFKPLIPANRYVHEDEHIEWLKGRTRSVCRRLAWSKTQ